MAKSKRVEERMPLGRDFVGTQRHKQSNRNPGHEERLKEHTARIQNVLRKEKQDGR